MTKRNCAIITGGVGTIGWNVSLRLARDGFAVAVIDVSQPAIDKLVEEIHNAGGRAIGMVADVRKSAEIASAVDKAASSFGPIDALVNIVGHAGDRQIASITEIDDDLWDDVMTLNLRSAFAMCRAVLPKMEREGYGRIVNFSTAAFNGTQAQIAGCRLAYVVSKSAVNGLTRQLAQDYADKGITVNAVAPALVLGRKGSPTREKFERRLSKEAMAGVLKQFPQNRAAEPDEVAEAISFLCSPGASYVSGQVIRVDCAKN